jgi:hypothetical protein
MAGSHSHVLDVKYTRVRNKFRVITLREAMKVNVKRKNKIIEVLNHIK